MRLTLIRFSAFIICLAMAVYAWEEGGDWPVEKPNSPTQYFIVDAPGGVASCFWQESPSKAVFYLSTDRGETWEMRGGISGVSFYDVGHCGQGMYVASIARGEGVYYSHDTGATWHKSSDDAAVYIASHPITGMAGFVKFGEQPEPSEINISADKGVTWETIAVKGDAITWSSNGDGFVISTKDEKIYRSTDKGATWTEAASLTDSPFGGSGAFYSSFSAIDDVLFVVDAGTLYRSTDLGATWTEISAAKMRTAICYDLNELVIPTSIGGIENQSGVYVTTNNGKGPLNEYSSGLPGSGKITAVACERTSGNPYLYALHAQQHTSAFSFYGDEYDGDLNIERNYVLPERFSSASRAALHSLDLLGRRHSNSFNAPGIVIESGKPAGKPDKSIVLPLLRK